MKTQTIRYAVRSSIALTGLLALAACGGSDSGDATGSGANSTATQSNSSSAPARTLTVFAAASLQKPFEEIGDAFEKAHPGVTVKFSFGGSSGLVAQLQEGAPAHVLATANEATMDKAVADSLISGTPTPFVSNTLQIVVPQDNPAGITGLADLTKSGTKVVLCAPAVPCGAASTSVEKSAGIDIKPVSEEQSVTDVLGKVRSGEADAGLVYVTDVAGAGTEVKGIDFPEAKSAINIYPIAALKSATDAALATEFVSAITGADGQAVLREAGFAAP
ncbi:molybdate ABC transporter substrate-binding protein [Knoellia subterranea]|uniref:Molybdate-binding protein n=1 Tax=Knoellia subterranea KCTC 19937 TaxID=1385521 RepID=A0A0A0JJR9_9MICO|nr:molybdate ABC transporter substrate-binding protein [Knoellia subterranea]KGN37343.1 molybdate-binding protein [Knoellia subterranea KCTC 19937]